MSETQTDMGMVIKIGHLYPTLMSVAADKEISIQLSAVADGVVLESRSNRSMSNKLQTLPNTI